MAVYVKDTNLATSVEWDRIWHECGYATYFHSREWAETWRDYTHGKMCPEPKLIAFNDGVRALLPLSCERIFKGLAKRYVSSPAGTFGGWISTDNLSRAHVCRLTDILMSYSNIVWRINPYNNLTSEINIAGMKADGTRVIDLELGFDGVVKNWSKGHYAAVTQARKAGVVVRLAETLQDWHLYYDAYIDSIRRWGSSASSRYTLDLFDLLFNRHSPYVKLWLAMYEDKVISGALCFYSRKHVVYWHGATIEKYFSFRPTNLLMYEAILDACNRGYRWFDFNPSGGHEGAEAFKKSFGCEVKACGVYVRESCMVKAARKVSTLARHILKSVDKK